MGKSLLGNRAKVTDFLQRRHARAAHAMGHPIELCFDHPGIRSKTRVQEAGTERFANLWATAFYEEPIHIETTLSVADRYELEDPWVVGEDGLVFSDPDHVLGVCHHVQNKFPRKARRPIRVFSRRIEEPVFIFRGRSSENRGFLLNGEWPLRHRVESEISRAGGLTR